MRRLLRLFLLSLSFSLVVAQTPVIDDLTKDPRSLTNQDFRSVFNLGLNFFFDKSYEISIMYFLEALRKDPRHFWSRYFLGLAFYKLGKNDEATREWENLIRLGQERHALKERLARIYKSQDISDREKLEGTYVWIQDYPHQGSTRKMGIPMDLDLSSQNELLVLDFSYGDLVWINHRGQLVKGQTRWRDQLNFLKPLKNPWSFYQSDSAYWISDFTSDQLVKVEPVSGKVLKRIGTKGRLEGQFLGPKGVDGDEYGNLFVVDSGNSRVQYLNKEGVLLRNFGRRGKNPGDFLNPDDVIYYPQKRNFLVSDKGNRWVAEYNLKGDLVRILGEGVLEAPSKLLFKEDHELLVLDRSDVYRLNLANSNPTLSKLKLKKESNRKKDNYTSIALGRDRYLYLGNALKKKVEVFSPIEFTYINWITHIEGLSIKKFPIVQLEVSVKDPLFNPIRGMEKDDFIVYENGIRVAHKLQSKPRSKRLVLLIEQSHLVEEKRDRVNVLINEFFDGLRAGDQIKVITFNDDGYQEKTDFSDLRFATIDRALKGRFTSSYLVTQAFQRGVRDLYDTDFDRALILVMFSSLSIKALEGSSFENLLNLARNHQLPVYVFYLGNDGKLNEEVSSRLAGGAQKSEEDNYLALKIAKATGGEYYSYDLEAVKQFYQDHQNFDPGLYRLHYQSVPHSKLSSFTRRVKVVVKHRKSLGEDGLMIYPIP